MGENQLLSWKMTEPKGKFQLVESKLPELNQEEVLVKVSGCGVCHTDISFWHHGVKTRHELPLTLGHEISGTVIAGAADWIGKNVIIPAVLPCGECELCKSGRGNICQNQLMPGNDFDGGFASHIKVHFKSLCPVPDSVISKYSLEKLAVIADAVTTPYQVIKKSGLEAGNLAIIIGVGGIGIYGALLAKITGAKVIALDVDENKLNVASQNGVDGTLNIKEMDIKSIKTKVKEIAKEIAAPKYGWKLYEMSGTRGGQELAFALLSFASTLSIVGFTMDKLEVRLSNLMAFDAQIIGTWGCKPELYPEVIDLIAKDKLKIDQFVQTFPLSQINEIFNNTLEHKYSKRSVLVPDFK